MDAVPSLPTRRRRRMFFASTSLSLPLRRRSVLASQGIRPVTQHPTCTTARQNRSRSSNDPQSAAERAGLKPGDLVTELDGTPVRDAADLQLRLALLRIGEVAEFAVSRPGGAVTVRAAMAEREPAARSK